MACFSPSQVQWRAALGRRPCFGERASSAVSVAATWRSSELTRTDHSRLPDAGQCSDPRRPLTDKARVDALLRHRHYGEGFVRRLRQRLAARDSAPAHVAEEPVDVDDDIVEIDEIEEDDISEDDLGDEVEADEPPGARFASEAPTGQLVGLRLDAAYQSEAPYTEPAPGPDPHADRGYVEEDGSPT